MKIFAKADTGTIKKTIKIYREELKPEKKAFTLSAIFVPMQHFLHLVMLPLLISFFTQALITHPHDITLPIWLLVAMVVTSVAAMGAGHIGFIALFNHEERMHTILGERAMRGLLAHSYTFFANSKVGSLAGDVASFARSYQTVMDAVFLNSSSIVVNFVTSLIIVAFVAPIMLPVLLIMTVMVIYDALRSYNNRAPYRIQRKEMTSKLYGMVADALGNQTLVRMFGRSEYEVKLVVNQRREIEKVAGGEIVQIQRGAESRMMVLFTFQIVTLVICMYLLSHSAMTIAAFIFIITYLGRVSGSMFAINSVIRTLEQGFLDAAKVTEILDQTVEIRDAPNARKLHIKNGEIEFSNVSFAYEEAKEQVVFNNMNLKINSGESIGLVGKSGGGKSTLTHLLLRYMDIDSGEILIDGQNIANVTQKSLREAIAFVPQDPFLFHRTLRENIAYGNPDATDEEIIKAARAAHAMEFIDELPKGLDTVVGERGVKLSGGQRQRIAIARAILKDAPILVLDEATSALDSESEVYIQQALEKLMKDRTSIVIAHRLSTIAKLNRIIVLDKGTIVEEGTHTKLLDNSGTYAKLWKHQSGGFIN
jgi:ATP-binding cassette, subfamily B, bacterial